MADIFTDEVSDISEDALYSDADQDFSSEVEPVPETPDQPEVPVQSEQSTLDHETGDSGDLLASSDQKVNEGVETVPGSDPIEQIDYTELLKQQNQQLESLVMETKEMNQQLTNLNHSTPIMVCMLGFVAGVLLVQIFSSYFRV